MSWFIYVQKQGDTRKALVSGPYPTREQADERHYPTVYEAEKRIKGGAWLWFETWGVCELPADTTKASVLGIV